jgi:cytochrome c oxidase assembly protein subunit 15
MVAAFVGLLAIVLAVWLWRRDRRRWMRWLGLAALGAVITQGVLGGLTVIFMLPTAISVAHASLAQLFFSTTVSIALFTSRWWHTEWPQREATAAAPVRPLAVAAAAAIFVQLVLGAAFRHKGIGIWPHLGGAGLVAALAYRIWRVVRQSYPQVAALRRPATLLAGLVALQLALGAAALWARVEAGTYPQPMPLLVGITVAHVVLGAITLAAAVVLGICAFRTLKPAGELALDSRPERAAI